MSGSYATIDRFEGDKAVLIFPDRKTMIVARGKLPAGAKEGDLVEINFSVNQAKTKKAKTLINKLLSKLLKSQRHENT